MKPAESSRRSFLKGVATLAAGASVAPSLARAERLAIHLSGSAQPDCWNLQEIVARVGPGSRRPS